MEYFYYFSLKISLVLLNPEIQLLKAYEAENCSNVLFW